MISVCLPHYSLEKVMVVLIFFFFFIIFFTNIKSIPTQNILRHVSWILIDIKSTLAQAVA